MNREELIQEIKAIITSNKTPKIIREQLEDYHENDIAQAMQYLDVKDRKKLYRIATVTMLADFFEYLDEDEAVRYFNEMDIRKVADVISELEPDTASFILKELDKDKKDFLIDFLNPEIRKEIQMVSAFDDDEIGSRMTTNYIVIRENLTVPQAMKELVTQAEENDNISIIFVVDENNTFYGAIDLKDLIIARKTDNLEDLIMTAFPYVYASESIDECIEELKDYSEDSIPVLDNSNKLLGVITSQGLIEVVDDEMGEDYARFAGLTAEDDLKEPLALSIRKRLPWLMILLGLGMIVSSVVGIFEKIIAQLTIIMAFQSLILDMAGNVGTQSLAVTIRVLVNEKLTAGDKVKLVLKEMKVGLCNGVMLGSLSFIFIGLYIHFFKARAWLFAFSVSGCIGISLFTAMLISSAVGTLIPMFFKKINIDPAVASGPLITTINDLVAVVTYYGMSWILLINILKLS
jgi:magnesium transporter